jgi:hypothetical protein
MSLQARGKFGDTIIYSGSKGRSYAKPYKQPTVRRFPTQRAVRAVTKFLMQAWKDGTYLDKAAYELMGEESNISGINSFQKFNFSRIFQGKGPVLSFPPSNGICSAFHDYTVITGLSGAITGSIGLDSSVEEETIAGICISQTVSLPLPSTLACLFTISPGSPVDYSILNVPPGTWYMGAYFYGLNGDSHSDFSFLGQVTVS